PTTAPDRFRPEPPVVLPTLANNEQAGWPGNLVVRTKAVHLQNKPLSREECALPALQRADEYTIHSAGLFWCRSSPPRVVVARLRSTSATPTDAEPEICTRLQATSRNVGACGQYSRPRRDQCCRPTWRSAHAQYQQCVGSDRSE